MSDGTWLRKGRTVYALESAGWRKGEEQFRNRWSFHVQGGPAATLEEVEEVARTAQAAPAMKLALQEAASSLANVAALHDSAYADGIKRRIEAALAAA